MILQKSKDINTTQKSIVFVLDWHSDSMGYSDNFLPEAMARLGWNVHVISSTREVFYNRRNKKWYKQNLEKFLGAGKKRPRTYNLGKVTIYRLRSVEFAGKIFLLGLSGKIRKISPHVVQVGEYWVGSTLQIAKLKHSSKFFFTVECHVHKSVFSPPKFSSKFVPREKLLTYIAKQIDFCFPISNESAEITHHYFGYPMSKTRVINLGTDTTLFKPLDKKMLRRTTQNLDPNAFICIYTGKFIEAKGAHLLVEAMDLLSRKGHNVQAILIGDGDEAYTARLFSPNSLLVPFMPAKDLVTYYGICDLAVWPKQESTSQLDALACGLPIIISNTHGDISRAEGSGCTYHSGDSFDLALKIESYILDKIKLEQHSIMARRKAIELYSWDKIATAYSDVFLTLMAD